MKAFILLFVLMALVFCLPADEVIREQVMVKWFAVPMTALDGQGKCVTDLKPEEIDVRLDGHKVDSFRLVRLSYTAEKEREGPLPEVPTETPVAFLVFDNILTDANKLNRAKAMAIEMVKRAEGRQPFVVMSLECFSGLKCLCGPSRQTGEIIAAIEKKVRASRNLYRFYDRDPVSVQIRYAPSDSNLTREESEDKRRVRMRKQDEYTMTVFNYLHSLKTLCLAMQTIRYKSVFLFSTGIKSGFSTNNDVETSDGPAIKGLMSLVKDLVEQINRTGSFLVAINPDGKNLSISDSDSGEQLLHYMASASGGQYLDGPKESMEAKVLEMTRAFYDLQFADPGIGERKKLHIDVSSKRPGVSIHSLRHVSRSREYRELTKIEKELLAVDAVESSYWASSIMTIRGGKLPEPGISNKRVSYDLALPAQFQQKEIDIFFLQVNNKNNDAKVKSWSLIAESDRTSFAVKPLQGYEPAILIVCGSMHQAILLR